MRHPAFRVLLVVILAAVLVAGAGIVVSGNAPSSQTAGSYGTTPTGEPIPTATPTSTHSTDPVSVDMVPRTDPRTQLETTFDPDSETRIRVALRPDRDAEWEVVVRYELADADRTAPFERAGEQFLDGEIGPDPALFERFAAESSTTVDRDMEITDVDREVVVIEDPDRMDVEDAGEGDVGAGEDPPAAVGELRLTFVWTEFLAVDGENLELGDAFTTPNDGTWLQSLEATQTIEVMTPEGYSVSGTPGATIPLRENAVVIEGPRVFEGDDRVVVVYAPQPSEPSAPPWTLLAGAIVLAALLIAGGLVGYRRIGVGASNGSTGADGDHSGASASGTDSGTNGNGAGGTVPAEGGDPGARDPETGADDTAHGGTEPTEDLSLLSDEERVERLLERNGGRMRQADIVAETGWSDAKVSQLLSAMSDDGRVEKLRLGRENLISVPDTEQPGEERGPEAGDADDGSTGDDDSTRMR